MILNTSRWAIIAAILLATLAFADLESDLCGTGIDALFPGDGDYDAARNTYNRRFSFSPAAIAYPNSLDDVSKVIQIGARNQLQVIPRSGGHSFISNGAGGKDGALIVDLSNMTQISIDSSSHIATIQTGNRLGDVAINLNGAGRALPHAFGGWGLTSRMWGLTLDTIKAINTVFANGTTARITADNFPDLFWALRGAAPSFGITTSIEVETFPAPQHALIYSYTWSLAAEAAGQALLDFQSFALITPDLPPEYRSGLTWTKSNTSGEVLFNMAGGWYDEPHKLDGVLKPLLDKLPAPLVNERIGNGTWIDSVEGAAASFNDSLKDLSMHEIPDTFYSKSLMSPEGAPLTPAAANAFMRYLADNGSQTNVNWFVQALLFGGTNSKTNAIPVDSTAFVRRDALFTWDFRAFALNESTVEEGLAFTDGAHNSLVESMPSNWDYSAYINYVDDRQEDWQKRYYGAHYDRLRSIKTEIDPNDIFSFPTSIEVSELEHLKFGLSGKQDSFVTHY
ncbi:hypothetical protein V5O48_007097 [Marasmius crinis-equi]|uniref:FAD-binding PCMH-type domain-containing protein n=1 Tax=Marasmius crinis-equi TaxID=585013 RepID=A0ABR3FHQ6_9AGAR